MQVLIADDEAVARHVLAGTLLKAGFETLIATDGEQALAMLRQTPCQLVVSDWEMPGLSGIDLCRAVRGGEFLRYIYFIMLTGHDRSQDVIDGLNAGADDFVTKPFNPQEIVVRLRAGQRLLTLESAEMTIFALARLAESRDPETGAHLERVRSYCRALATQLRRAGAFADEIDEQYLHLIYQTSPLHDIGKVAIPDCVLLKAGRLTDEEFDIMKTHTTHGAATLEAASSRYPNAAFLRMARNIALTHHEKYDGTGYPGALAGEAIPLCGRIVAVADVYDALTSRRVYKDAFTHAVARSIILDDRDSHFDPAVTDSFIACEAQFMAIRARYADQPASQAA